jgi:multidrug resistance efflux pump
LAKQVEAAQADVEAAEATIKQSQAAIKGYSGRVVESRKEYKRQKTLDKQGATSKRAVETARANWVAYVNQKATADAQLLQMQASLSEANANLAKARADLGAPGEKNAQVRQAKAEVRSAELNLEFTQKKAPVDGYVTNLNLRLGSQAVENQPILALVDVNSYWVTGFFRENYIEGIRKGDRTIVTLMTYPDKPLEGWVDSLGWGIAQDDGSTGFDLLPNISPTFEWIRLAQRVPVRIHFDLDKLPEEIKLRVGTTASVLVMTGTSGSDSGKAVVAAPRALQ